ncbi:MAG: cell wall-binding repeat-containing protein [Actinobacteria bacterium]|nr:cell wall-binding repeat-containing protein [Actinomycetota bacterium]
MRLRIVVTVLALLSAALMVPSAGAAPGHEPTDLARRPASPNPFLALLPTSQEPDVKSWSAYSAEHGRRAHVSEPDPGTGSVQVVASDESEPNDTYATGDTVAGFGTAIGEDNEAQLSGHLEPLPAAPSGVYGGEDDGARGTATVTGLTFGTAVSYSAEIGDGPHGSSGSGSGDLDYYRVEAEPGEHIVVDVDASEVGSSLDPTVAIFTGSQPATGSDGELPQWVAFNDDAGGTLDSFLDFTVEDADTYYVLVTGFGTKPKNLDDSASGTGAESEGPYEVTIARTVPDIDFYSFSLDAGDVLGATITSGDVNRVAIHGPGGTLLMASNHDPVFGAYPGQSPLEGGGPHAAIVAHSSGTYAVAVGAGAGPYEVSLQAYLPGSEGGFGSDQQVVFLDFDGATIADADRIWGGKPDARLSPLRDFLTRWGLDASDEDALIDRIVAVVRENVDRDLRGGLNGDRDTSGTRGSFDVEILNSRDHPDPGDGRLVSRIVIGGTIEELGVPTIGIAQSIDLGNYDLSEIGVVLLDLLSTPSSNANSFNSVPRGSSATKLELVGTGVGNIAAHELGHVLGSWHTDPLNAAPQLMDQGGFLPNLVGVGDNGVFDDGGDDTDVDFGTDIYVAEEGFVGLEHTAAHTAHALSTGTLDVAPDAFGGLPIGGDLGVSPSDGVLANDRGGRAGELTASLARPAWHGDVTLAPDGSFLYNHDGGSGVTDTFSYTATATGHPSPATTVTIEVGVDETFRLWGDDRILTAVDISQSSFPANGTGALGFGSASQAKAVVLARSDDFADGLTGTPFAHAVGAPLLLTPPDELSVATRTEIRRLLGGAGTVYVLGGEVAVHPEVVLELRAEGHVVERIFGQNRYETAAAIARALGSVDTVIVARATVFADALAAGPAAIASNGAIVLSADDQPHPVTTDYLDEVGAATVFAAGGPAATAYPGAVPLVGGTRFETAELVAAEFFDRPPTVGVARSDVFADALTGGVHAGKAGGPILLTETHTLHATTARYLLHHAADLRVAWVYGGEAAVAEPVVAAVGAAIG